MCSWNLVCACAFLTHYLRSYMSTFISEKQDLLPDTSGKSIYCWDLSNYKKHIYLLYPLSFPKPYLMCHLIQIHIKIIEKRNFLPILPMQIYLSNTFKKSNANKLMLLNIRSKLNWWFFTDKVWIYFCSILVKLHSSFHNLLISKYFIKLIFQASHHTSIITVHPLK